MVEGGLAQVGVKRRLQVWCSSPPTCAKPLAQSRFFREKKKLNPKIEKKNQIKKGLPQSGKKRGAKNVCGKAAKKKDVWIGLSTIYYLSFNKMCF